MIKSDFPLQPIPIAYYAGDGCKIFNYDLIGDEYDLAGSEEAQKWQVSRYVLEEEGANGRIKGLDTPQRLFLDGKWSSDWNYENEAEYQFPSAAAAWEALKRARETETQKQQQGEAIVADQIRKADPLAPIDLDALLSPEGPYMRSNGHEDNAQLVDQLEWWAPVYGCDTLETLLNQIRARILPYLRPPIAGIDVPGPASDDERESVATAIEEEAQWFEHGQKTAAVMRRAAALLRQPAPAALPDTRDPECVAVWPDCCDGMYDPRCCRFPKSCSCEIPSPPIPESQANSMTSDNPPLQPLSEQELRDQWNAQADQFNQWA